MTRHLTVKQRVEQMIAGARREFSCSLSINQSHRSAEQAQQFHVCHMFLHNFFKHLTPKHVAADGRTIDWLHLSDPNVKWVLIPQPENFFLYAKDHKPAQKRVVNGSARWVPGHEPNKQTTVHIMKQFLDRANVTSMAAPGVDGCGEPCGCGGHASKHITGLACDVGGMAILGDEIVRKKKAHKTSEEAVDHFLAQYGLWRPLAHLPGKAREAWHLEALPPHHVHSHSHHPHHHQQTHVQSDSHLHTKLNHERLLHRHGC